MGLCALEEGILTCSVDKRTLLDNVTVAFSVQMDNTDQKIHLTLLPLNFYAQLLF